MVEVAVTPGTAAASGATALEKPPCALFGVVTMMSALIALSTLLVADFDNDAPNTAMADTSANPTISAEAVWAVRRGLRIEFSRPSRPDVPSMRASGRPRKLDIGRATSRSQPCDADEDQHRAQSHQRDDRLGEAVGQGCDTGQGDDSAPRETAAQRDVGLGLLLGDGSHRRNPHGTCVPG